VHERQSLCHAAICHGQGGRRRRSVSPRLLIVSGELLRNRSQDLRADRGQMKRHALMKNIVGPPSHFGGRRLADSGRYIRNQASKGSSRQCATTKRLKMIRDRGSGGCKFSRNGKVEVKKKKKERKKTVSGRQAGYDREGSANARSCANLQLIGRSVDRLIRPSL